MQHRFTVVVILIIGLAIGVSPYALGQRKEPSVGQVLNTGSQGTEFFLAIPPNEIDAYPVVGLEIYVASAVDANIEIFDYAGDKSTRFQIKPYEILTLSDNAKSGKAVLNWAMEVRDAEQPSRQALRIRSDKPVSVYVINSKQLTTDGYMAIPVSGWGQEYLTCSYSDFKEVRPWAGGFVVIAREPTKLTLLLRGSGKTGAFTSKGRKIGDTINVTLDEGDVYMVHGDGMTRGEFDLTGSLISADRPVGVIGFHMRTTMPNLLVNGNGRNHLCEMLPPANTWGKRYATTELQRSRLLAGRGDVFRVIAKQPDTKWTCKYYEKASGKLLGQRGGTISTAGGFADELNATQPTALVEGFSVWEADKPIFLMQYSCSSSWDGDQILDPFMMCVNPSEQYVTEAFFQTPTMSQFYKHYLNLVIKTDTSDPNLIENLKSLQVDGQPVWSNAKSTKPSLLFSRMPNGMYFAGLEFGTEARAHRVTSNGLVSFSGYIYGFGAVDAYGWPISSALRRTYPADTLPPVIVKGKPACGDYALEATELRNIPDPPKKLPNDADQLESGIAKIDSVAGRGSFNYRLVLITDQTFPQSPSYKRFKYEWQVIDKSKDARVVYYVADVNSNAVIDSCIYVADKVVATPNALSFGKLRLGSSKTITLTLKNNQSADIILNSAKIKAGTTFKLKSGTIADGKPLTIPAGGSTTLDVQFLGTRETTDILKDWDRDTLTITTVCGQLKYDLTGVAAVPRIKVADFSAGTRDPTQQYCSGLRIENPGSDTLRITSITGYENSPFSLPTGYTPRLPIIVLPKDSVELRPICFRSVILEEAKREVTFSSNADGPDSVSTWTGSTLPSSVQTGEPGAVCDNLSISTSGRVATLNLQPDQSAGQLTVFDLRGRVVYGKDLSEEGPLSVTTSPLQPGAYVALFAGINSRCHVKFQIDP